MTKDEKMLNLLLQINMNLVKLIQLMEEQKKNGIKVRTQESHA